MVLWEELFVCCLWEGQVWWVPGCESWFGGEIATGSEQVVRGVGDWGGGQAGAGLKLLLLS